MTLPALAAQSDVESLLGQPLTTQQALYCANLLAIASGKVRHYCHQQFTQTLNDTIVLQGVYGALLTLPERPVTNVESVQINGVAPTPTSWIWNRYGQLLITLGSSTPSGDSDFYFGTGNDGFSTSPLLAGPAGSIYPGSGMGPNWGGPSAQVTVVYDHGYATIPASVVNEVAGMVAGQLATPTGINSEKIGGYSVSYARSAGAAMQLTAEAKSVLNDFRKRNVTLPMGVQR